MSFPTLNQNKIQNALYNMIISQDVLGGSIKDNYNLVDKARVDGSLYGDTKLYIDTPTLVSVEWDQDSGDATNLLALHRPPAPATQAITFGKYRQVQLTKDAYLSKQAFGTEGAFSQYQSVLSGRLSKTKEMYDTLTYNAFFGTVKGAASDVSIPLSDITDTGREKNAAEAEMIGQYIADLISDMKDYNTKYTTNGFIRAFSEDEIGVVWNTKYINKIRKISLPGIYHNENLIDKFGEDQLPARMFGTVNTTAKTTADSNTRSLIEQVVGTGSDAEHYFPGDAITVGTSLVSSGAITVPSYQEDANIICKVYTKLPPYMSAFTANTEFFNAKNLSTNMYLTFGHNNLEALKSEAIVTVIES